MIRVKKIIAQTVEHFDPNGDSLGFLNEMQNLDLRKQIKQHKAKGYYLMYQNERIDLMPNGQLSKFPNGLYDLEWNLLKNLFNLQD